MSITVINTNDCEAVETADGSVTEILGRNMGAERVSGRIQSRIGGAGWELSATSLHHLVFQIGGRAGDATLNYNDGLKNKHRIAKGRGINLAPGDKVRIKPDGDAKYLHLAVEQIRGENIRNGSYFFDPKFLRRMRDDKYTRFRVFFANSRIHRPDGRPLSTSRCMQTGVIDYIGTAASPLHMHAGSEHFYFVLTGEGQVEGEYDSQQVTPGSLVFIPRNTLHRMRSSEQGLTFLEFHAPDDPQTTIIEGAPEDLRWFYEDTNEEWLQG